MTLEEALRLMDSDFDKLLKTLKNSPKAELDWLQGDVNKELEARKEAFPELVEKAAKALAEPLNPVIVYVPTLPWGKA